MTGSVAAGVSLLGKGMIGPGIVGLLVLADMLVRGRLDLLRRVEQAIPGYDFLTLGRTRRW